MDDQMSRRGSNLGGIRSLLCCAFMSLALAAEPAHVVPPPVAELLTAAAQVGANEQIALIDGWKGEAHALLTLTRAQARWSLARDAANAARPAQIAAAEKDFAAVLVIDPELTQAHLGLAQCAAAREDWLTASREAAAGIDPGKADRTMLGFLANAALRAGDWRLATLSAQHGIMRFPDDAALRRIELAVLVHTGRSEDARQAVLALLARDPGDDGLWRHLAWSANETGRADEALGALEAALAVSSDDRALRRQLAEAQLARGLPQAALVTVKPLVGEPPTPVALADDGLILLSSRAAADSGELTLARAWLAAVPDAKRTRNQRINAARFAVQAGDAAAAGASLDALVAAGERDPAVLVWAASLAEMRHEPARAEALLLQALDAGTASTASLHLAAFYLKHDRRDEARTVLATYLAKKPDDVQARALKAQFEHRRDRHQRNQR